jgi:hypothetical protein
MITDKGALNNMKALQIIAIPIAVFFISGCVIEGNRLVNATDGTVSVVVHSDNTDIKREIGPHLAVGERRMNFKDRGVPYSSVEAFDTLGKKLGALDLHSTRLPVETYGRFLTLMICDQGIFPVPVKYQDHPEKHLAEIVAAFRSR